jgi:N-acetylneuraminate synthase
MADRTFVIAEAGVNHNGSLDTALRLVDVAADCGADAVKFQTFKAGSLVTAKAERAPYQIENLKDDGTQLAMLQQLELSADAHRRLDVHCRERGIRFMSTAFDADSLRFLAAFDMPAVKIASGDITCGPLLLQAARLRKPLILSTGMSTLGDIEAALGALAFGLVAPGEPQGRADLERAYASAEGQAALVRYVSLLHCVTQYPAPPESVHLRAMATMRDAFGLPVGYSDHTLGIEVAIAAVALGATIIEKHFTLDRAMPGPDHAASLEPGELAMLIAAIRNVERALGSPQKRPTEAEAANRTIARRSVVAARPIRKGEAFNAESLAFKRPGTGCSPLDYWDIVGRIAARDYAAEDAIDP